MIVLGSNALLTHSFPQYFNLANMAMIIVLGSVEDERAFSTVGFVKGKLRNNFSLEILMLFLSLSSYLNLHIKFYCFHVLCNFSSISTNSSTHSIITCHFLEFFSSQMVITLNVLATNIW